MHKNRIPKKQPLHVKILVGYILLTVLVVGIIAAVWYEKCVFQEAEQEERAMLEQRCLTCPKSSELPRLLSSLVRSTNNARFQAHSILPCNLFPLWL